MSLSIFLNESVGLYGYIRTFGGFKEAFKTSFRAAKTESDDIRLEGSRWNVAKKKEVKVWRQAWVWTRDVRCMIVVTN